ncbi:Phytanoyl-CoA dioxygenase (PhyH) [Sphingopyxis sp. YR583]|uniref:phytanoyl-CoA dioxygenase family protein n=1 Tax=Sphingopyxis sp. YR583 TaxID=1881047 RepID=UPI0008A7ABAE|nr:phytanoyl-CoA dioxygenase family protein [Sphingopyxis sp. YR583]SEH12837.1 Phytanoyl-CoA dioxygenase (PhyH) [Sphingopyxis sp. YR583]
MKGAFTPDSAPVRLERDGWCLVRHALPPGVIAGIDAMLAADFAATPFCVGDFFGERTKRFGRLLTRAPATRELVMHPAILLLAEHMLGPGCDRIALNLTQAIEIHPGALAQYPHRDHDLWPIAKGGMNFQINVMWPLVPFTAENGATRLWTGSHKAEGSGLFDEADAVAAECQPGDALLWLGGTLHGAGGNASGAPRRGIVVSYCLGWLKPFELPWLIYPPEAAKAFDPDLAALVGYAQHRPNLGNVEGRCPSYLLGGEHREHVAAVDALLPEQEAALRAHVAAQRGAAGHGQD